MQILTCHQSKNSSITTNIFIKYKHKEITQTHKTQSHITIYFAQLSIDLRTSMCNSTYKAITQTNQHTTTFKYK